jgi:uncharacterized cupin superfamily protein
MTHLIKLPPLGDAEWEPVASSKIVSGSPQTRTWVHYDDAAQKLSAGVWEATPGKWRIAYTEWEYVRMLSGSCILTGDDGSTLTAGPGDAFVIEPGFTGTWEVTEPMRKLWVIRE